MEFPKLLPCPFCGATEDDGIVSVFCTRRDNIYTYGVSCKKCGTKVIPYSEFEPWGFSKYSAIRHWNYRMLKNETN